MQSNTPPGTKKIIIFDTNAYRVLASGLTLDQVRSETLQLRTKEQEIGNFALANPIVIWELIAHLDDSADPAYAHCLNAMVALGEHTASPFKEHGGICYFADAESTVCRDLFQKVPQTLAENIQNIVKLGNYVTKNAPNIGEPAVAQNLKVFSRELKTREAAWLADMKNVLLQFDPKVAKAWVGGTDEKTAMTKLRNYLASNAFMEAWAVVMVVRHARYADVKLNSEELALKSKAIKEIFPTPFHMMSALFQKFSNSPSINLNSRKKKWENFMCDLSICFCIGKFHEIDGAAIFFVTGDGAIKQAADAAACSDRVLTLDEYLKSVGI